jgi:rod shape-determining protein MreC
LKNFLKNHGIWVLFAGAVIAAALALMSFFNASPLVDITGVLASPFRSAYTSVVTWFQDKQAYYKDVKALEAENAALKQTIAEMEETVRHAQADRDENELLRRLLNLRAQRRDLSDLEAATITEHSVTNWSSSLTLNKGTYHGVEVGDCVMDATGALVGVISEVGYNWSTVLTTVDTDTSLGARVFRTKDLGIAQGDFALMGEDLLRLDYLPSECELLTGDLVETSGLGGFYPTGLVIGYVKEVRMDDSGASSYAILTPAVDFDSLTEVFILKSFEIVT